MKHASLAFVIAATLLLAACVSDGLVRSETDAEKAAQLNKELGTLYLRQGNLALAKEKLERAEKYNSRDPETHSVLALLYEKLDIPKLVDEHYRRAIDLAPKDPEISNNYAVYLCRKGRTDEGVERFLRAARNPLYRTPEAAYTNAGVCQRAADRLDEARNAFAHALQIRPGYAEAAYQAAALDFSRGELTQGRDQVDQFLASHDATPELLLLGVRINRALGDRLGEEKYTRRLRVEFPGSKQLQALSDQKSNPG
jgi:type IV pilus assembly protein PilF